jgi:hypothetical protein
MTSHSMSSAAAITSRRALAWIHESPVCLGVLGVNADIIKRAQAVNTAKAKFKSLCTPRQGIRIRIPAKGERTPTKAIPAIRVILRNIQRSDLNLLAADRERLVALDRGVTHLALAKDRGRIQTAAELPLMYATGRRSKAPEVHFPEEAEISTKPKRTRKSKLEAEPYLASLPVYRDSLEPH